jgi:DNA-binding PadR family transcriptional regulator
MRGSWGGYELIWDGTAALFGKPHRRRTFDKGELRLLLLSLIAESPRHGYDLIREIESRTGGAYSPSPSGVYPTLTLLEEEGLIAAQPSEGAKKLFSVTEEGRRLLSERAGKVAALLAQVGELGERRSRSEGGPIHRAMTNLRVVLHERYGRGDITPEVLHQIAETIDEASRRIERLQA